MSDQPITESKKRQRTPKGAAEDKSAKKLKEDKKQLQQKSHEELQREETFKSWLTGLHKRRKVRLWFPRKCRRRQIQVQKRYLCFVVKSYVWVRDGFSFSLFIRKYLTLASSALKGEKIWRVDGAMHRSKEWDFCRNWRMIQTVRYLSRIFDFKFNPLCGGFRHERLSQISVS